MSVKDFLKGEIKYDDFGQKIFVDKGENVGHELILDVRAWGVIQNMFNTTSEANEFQDELGHFVVDALKEKLEREV